MQSTEASLKALIAKLPHPADKSVLDPLVTEALSRAKTSSSPEIRRNQWEYALKKEIFALAMTEGQALKEPNTRYYDNLCDRLDLCLVFSEHDVCDKTFPFTVLFDLLETQTIDSCSHIFSWIEHRADRLTEGMVPQKGKALVLLRTLNDLLRRLSKIGNTTIFPLGERSGVNLRGEYGPTWDGPGAKKEEGAEEPGPAKKEAEDETKMQVDEPKVEGSPESNKKKYRAEWYNTFWSLQLPFSRPPLFAEQGTFTQFKEAVNRVLPVIKEATAKERALMGSKTSAGHPSSLKRKRESEGVEDSANGEYFFAKYLTSPDLLELEIADTHFRRQFLFQLLILLNHLLIFTKAAKATWSSTRNRSLQIDFTLDTTDAQWVQETVAKATEELRQTTPNGRMFAETVHVILEREKNWVRWKNELCAPFDKEPWSEEIEVDGQTKKVGLEEATREVRKKMHVDTEPWPHKLIWEMGYRDLMDLERPFLPGEPRDFLKKIKQEDARIDMRRKQLQKQAERVAQARAKAAAAAAAAKETPKEPAPPAVATPTPVSARISSSTSAPLHPSLPAKPGTMPASLFPARISTPVQPAAAPAPNKQRWAWLALRSGRDLYTSFFDIDVMNKFEDYVKVVESPGDHVTRKFSMASTNVNAVVGMAELEESEASLMGGPEAKGDKPNGSVPTPPPAIKRAIRGWRSGDRARQSIPL
ncbi:THO complex subunit 1 transcription elongation factor-domain-containing protein [Fomitopsis serialis]|uniref:THO complex subunit 1 transcription elongation factor-domain-containing protein n=1 Tax=Fomitopsis serialis TaxID=139415 RepID=UPI002007A8E1|nr:THO complex subunit 1 transcription elongation factor-domain-containing protein [Neoantrodia serialis]KAH9929771.1 THO complex subunit 1 transcription elongation factor-domain-containing protein [Neoantrodia serialis]